MDVCLSKQTVTKQVAQHVWRHGWHRRRRVIATETCSNAKTDQSYGQIHLRMRQNRPHIWALSMASSAMRPAQCPCEMPKEQETYFYGDDMANGPQTSITVPCRRRIAKECILTSCLFASSRARLRWREPGSLSSSTIKNDAKKSITVLFHASVRFVQGCKGSVTVPRISCKSGLCT